MMDVSASLPVATSPALSPAAIDIDVSQSDLPFEVFYLRSSQSIAQALAATLGDVELAADATNEAMTRAYQRWSTVSSYDNPEAWVYRVGLNWSSSWRQRRRRERDRPIMLSAETSDFAVRDDSFDALLQRLPLDYRAVVVCRIHFDWSVEQTASALDIAPGTVKSRLARGLSKLRDGLASMQDPEPGSES